MSIRNKNKDHLIEHGGLDLVATTFMPKSDDPLRFFTNHPTENCLVDIRFLAEGESKNPAFGKWSGPFSARPELIAELAPAIEAQLTLASEAQCTTYKQALRTFWRICDRLEATKAPDGSRVERLSSVGGLTHLHEAAMHRASMSNSHFGVIFRLAKDTRRLMGLGTLAWTIPKQAEPIRRLIPDFHAKPIKIAIKRDWEAARKNWARNDAIRRGEEPDTLTEYENQDHSIVRQYVEENERRQQNWLHFEHIRKTTGMTLPTTVQLHGGKTRKALTYRGILLTQMRAIVFPTMEEAHIAFHAALMGSGWNPSTLITGIDATLPERVFQHPKDAKQSVLFIDVPEGDAEGNSEDIEVNMQGRKRRAGGRMQFCSGLKKNPDSPPNIVAAYLERTEELRELLRQDLKEADAELARLRSEDAPEPVLWRQSMKRQTLQQGLRNVWLYLGRKGTVEWIDGKNFKTLGSGESKGATSYLDLVIERLNAKRVARNEEPIARIVPSDFRDIFARWVYVQSGGSIIAVMLALGHLWPSSTKKYLENNIFSAENDEKIHRFMSHLFEELEKGRVDLTILAQLVRHGPVTPEMQDRLSEYRHLTRSRVDAFCADIKHPPVNIDPNHIEGKWCGTQRCLRDCPNARFLPESVKGIAMRVEELMVISDHLPLEAWMRGEFEKELESAEYLLANLYPQDEVVKERAVWHEKIHSGKHVVPGIGLIREKGTA